jgi:hypothetical protein
MGAGSRADRCSYPWANSRLEGRLDGVPDSKEADVPPGIFPVPKFRPTANDPTRPSLPLRVRTRRRRNRLDDELARGADPTASTELALRAAQLRSASGRRKLANALVETLGDARGPNLGAFGMKTRREHAAIREAADDLLALVLRLRDGEPSDVRGAAMTARLLSDGASPLHHDGGQDLQHAIRAARFALDSTHRATEDLARAA